MLFAIVVALLVVVLMIALPDLIAWAVDEILLVRDRRADKRDQHHQADGPRNRAA